MVTFTNLSRLAGVLVLLLVAARADAGPALLCESFEPGAGAVLLPWGDASRGWNTPDPAYDSRHLVRDTLRLLSADAPVLARMENLRRATIYAAGDRDAAAALFAALMTRARAADGSAYERALALFDAGYLAESYAQGHQVFTFGMLNAERRRTWTFDKGGREAGESGYPMVQQALALAGPNPAMEYAASLMTTGAASAGHRQRALAGGTADPVLARHLAR